MRVFVLCVFYAVFGFIYVLSPYWMMIQVGSALQNKDAEAVIKHVNLAALGQQLAKFQQSLLAVQDKVRAQVKRNNPNMNDEQINQLVNGHFSINAGSIDARAVSKKLLPELNDVQLDKISTVQTNNNWLENINLNFSLLPLGLTLPLTLEKLINALIAQQERGSSEGLSLLGLLLRCEYIDSQHMKVKLFSRAGVDSGLVLVREGWFEWKINRIVIW